MKGIILAVIMLTGVIASHAAQNKTEVPAKAAAGTVPLFDDPVLARGKGVEIRQSQVDEMYAAFRANRVAAGQQIPPGQRPVIESEILDKLIATRLCVNRATEADKVRGEQIAKEFLDEQIKQAPSIESFNRQLLAVGLSAEKFRAQIAEQAVVKAVLDRELKDKQPVTEAEARKFYEANPKFFDRSERVRVVHILISILDTDAGRELPAEQKILKRELAEKLLARAKAGEEFAKLVKEFSDDKNAKDRNGEYTLMRNERRYVLPPEFEGAAFSLAVNQISDLVVSSYGFHIIKCLEKLPAGKAPFNEVEARIRDTLQQEAVQKELPNFIGLLRREAGVEIIRADKAK